MVLFILSYACAAAICGCITSLSHFFGQNWKISTTFEWIAFRVCADIRAPQRMDPNDCGDPLRPQVKRSAWKVKEYPHNVLEYWNTVCGQSWKGARHKVQ